MQTAFTSETRLRVLLWDGRVCRTLGYSSLNEEHESTYLTTNHCLLCKYWAGGEIVNINTRMYKETLQ